MSCRNAGRLPQGRLAFFHRFALSPEKAMHPAILPFRQSIADNFAAPPLKKRPSLIFI
jgi:hypothetical protein